MERKTLIRLLVAVAIGVPLIVEAGTFVGLVDQHLGGDDDPTTTTTTLDGRAVGVGDDLLPDTAQVERVTGAAVYADGDWRFELSVAVNNTGDRPYTLRLGSLTTESGDRVEGAFSTGRLAPGESTTLTATWSIPSGSSPATVDAKAFTYGENETEATTATVRFGSVPVQYRNGS